MYWSVKGARFGNDFIFFLQQLDILIYPCFASQQSLLADMKTLSARTHTALSSRFLALARSTAPTKARIPASQSPATQANMTAVTACMLGP